MNVKLIQHIQTARSHQSVMRQILPLLQPGVTLQEIVLRVEAQIVQEGLQPAFPVGLAINDCVAHFTPDPMGDPISLKDGDLLKIDFGVHQRGVICDAAMSVGIGELGREMHQEILHISRRATMLGVEKAGVDVFLKEIGSEIEEYVMSKEVTYENKVYPLFTMRDLCGHSIGPYRVHGGKAVPNTRIDFVYEAKMLEDEVYAIEPFVTTGGGTSMERLDVPTSHYAINPMLPPPSPSSNGGLFYACYQTLPFSKYWSFPQENHEYLLELERKTQRQFIKHPQRPPLLLSYPPLYDIPGSYVAQHEENIYITHQKPILLTSMSKP